MARKTLHNPTYRSCFRVQACRGFWFDPQTKILALPHFGFVGKPLDPDRFPSQIERIMSGEAVWETA